MYKMVGKRRRLLDYLAKKDIERYRAMHRQARHPQVRTPAPASFEGYEGFVWGTIDYVPHIFFAFSRLPHRTRGDGS